MDKKHTLVQPSLFTINQPTYLSIGEVAHKLNVSEASVRNWIKTGYLKQVHYGGISKQSYEVFKEDIIGVEKLISRANKSKKDSHNHHDIHNHYLKLLQSESVDLSEIGGQYEASLANSYRNKEGIYYTPAKIVKIFFDSVALDYANLSFCDPCCGSGNFIITAIEEGFDPKNVYGFDTDPVAVEITKRRIFQYTGYKTENIQCLDFLEQAGGEEIQSFDFIFTNPPWGKKLTKKQRKDFAKIFALGENIDTSSLFFFASLRHLKPHGFLGFLLQDAFFNISSFEPTRRKALSLTIKALLDFGKPFKGLVTKAKGIILQKSPMKAANAIACHLEQGVKTRQQASFQTMPKAILNFACSQQEALIIEHLYNLPHTTLKNQATYGLGIVTGNNKRYCINEPQEGYIPVFKGKDIYKERVNAATHFIPNDFSLYQQVAPRHLFEAPKKLIYRFISSDLIFFYDTKQRYFLNSANMIILHDSFPIALEQLCDLLNSRVLNWLFRKIFETHKVLRSDIETLPLHTDYFATYSHFTETTFMDFLGIEDTPYGTFRIENENL